MTLQQGETTSFAPVLWEGAPMNLDPVQALPLHLPSALPIYVTEATYEAPAFLTEPFGPTPIPSG